MKTSFNVLFIAFFIPCLVFAQRATSPIVSEQTKADIAQIQRQIPAIQTNFERYSTYFPLLMIDAVPYVSFIGKLKKNSSITSDVSLGIRIGQGVGQIRSVRIPLYQLDKITQLSSIEFLELASKIKPYLERVRFDTRVDSVAQPDMDLPQIYTGKDVIIGMQDWGYDYTHPMFYDTTLQTNRILAAWDQFKRLGPHPMGFEYGTEYTDTEQLLNAKSDTANQYGYATHATHVAGIAGGSGAGRIAMGMAPEANFLFTTILVDEAAALDAWEWLYQKAKNYKKKLVVNMSWGLYHFGTNDGTSLLSQALTEYTNQGVLFVTSAGNNGNVNFHFQRTFNQDSILSRVSFYDYSLHDSLFGQSIHAWGEPNNPFELKFQIKKLNGTILEETSYFSTLVSGYIDSFLVVNTNDTIWYNVTTQTEHPQNQRPTARLRIKKTQPSLHVDLILKANSGNIHVWNLVELTTNGGNWGMPFLVSGSNYIGGDNLYGIGEPAAAQDALSVAAHRSEYLSLNGYLEGGHRANFSSIGPLYNDIQKPDISAPGVNILSSLSSYTDEPHPTTISTEFNSRTYYFASLSGTSMSSPVVAGICALIWESNPYLSPRQIKDIVLQTARTDQHTGEIPPEGSTKWGMGKINARSAIEKALKTQGVLSDIVHYKKNWSVYPNPTTQQLFVQGIENIEKVQLIDVNGKIIPLDPTKNSWSIEQLPAGSYLLRIQADNTIFQQKINKF